MLCRGLESQIAVVAEACAECTCDENVSNTATRACTARTSVVFLVFILNCVVSSFIDCIRLLWTTTRSSSFEHCRSWSAGRLQPGWTAKC